MTTREYWECQKNQGAIETPWLLDTMDKAIELLERVLREVHATDSPKVWTDIDKFLEGEK